MKTILLPTLLLICVTFSQAQTTRTLSAKLQLQMPSGKGTRGAAVAWHPDVKKYFAVFAGNAEFPMAVFSEEGKRLSGDEMTAGMDTRGLWFNNSERMLYGNAYKDGGWWKFPLDPRGNPERPLKILPGSNQPSDQSVGTYCADKNEVWFLAGTTVWTYHALQGEETFQDVLLYPGFTKEIADRNPGVLERVGAELTEDYNYTSVVCTRIPGAEAGLLNVTRKQIELYDRNTGLLTQVLKLPSDAPLLHTLFDFSYANGYFWIFDETARKWVGYK